MRPGLFLCGHPVPKPGHVMVMRDNTTRLELHEFMHDEEGFVICPEHKCRRYGWRATPRPATGTFGFSDLERERWELFHELPRPDPLPLREILGFQYLAHPFDEDRVLTVR